jgi:hypothetical protein
MPHLRGTVRQPKLEEVSCPAVLLFAAAIAGTAINDPVMQGCEYRVTCTAHSVLITLKVIGTSRTGN